MESYKVLLELISQYILEEMAKENYKPQNYTESEFLSSVIIFQNAIMDKMWNIQEEEGMCMDDRINMAVKCGENLKKLIHTYTGIDTHKLGEKL